ncbi:basement membrane-specific heparan sulfate proteoglycan core protein-like isoform X1 [Pseudorasbora parva]|uniref:basement membrane-specific heparan sulfate proteoglycan core protein-like isoform X1 n=1 Tax=Pseudorasbora parva TaxID=51549 RepID=UPI00351E19A6
MNSRLLPLILILLHITGSLTLDRLNVFCSQERICAVKGYQVTLKCSYSNINLKTVFWFSQKQSSNWRKNDEAEDLTLDSDYSGRVKQENGYGRSTLIISDLRERDSGEYQLMFIMKDGVKRLSSVAVSLTVTDLRVRMNPETTDPRDQRVKLTCDSSCTSGDWYHWMKDGQYYRYTESRDMFVSPSTDAGRYSCSLDRNLKHRSSSVCISNDHCWGVTYTSRRVCALMGSTVDISCTYTHPSGYSVNKTFWHYVQSGDLKDLREEDQFAGRVEYVGNTLRIKELKSNDSGEYQFMFITDRTEGKYSGSPGVILTVTDLMVISSPNIISERQEVILSCSTKCTLSDKQTYIWYKNGRQVTDGFTKDNKLYLDSVSNEELQEFSCAVGEIQTTPSPEEETQITPNPEEDGEESTALRNTAVGLCVFLTLALIGVLWYRRRKCTLSKTHSRVEKEEVLYDTVQDNTASSDLTQKADADQDIQYSSISFKRKDASSIPTELCETDTTETEDVHYSTVKFR